MKEKKSSDESLRIKTKYKVYDFISGLTLNFISMKIITAIILGAVLIFLGSCSQERIIAETIPQESGIESIQEYKVDDYRNIYVIKTKSERVTVFGHYKHGMVVIDRDSL